MRVYQCPVCHNKSVAWDGLSRVFLCHTTTCSSWFLPPAPKPPDRPEDVLIKLSLGQLEVDQEWINNQPSQASLGRNVAAG